MWDATWWQSPNSARRAQEPCRRRAAVPQEGCAAADEQVAALAHEVTHDLRVPLMATAAGALGGPLARGAEPPRPAYLLPGGLLVRGATPWRRNGPFEGSATTTKSICPSPHQNTGIERFSFSLPWRRLGTSRAPCQWRVRTLSAKMRVPTSRGALGVGGWRAVCRRVRAHLIEVADVLELGTCVAHWRAPAAALATSANLRRVPLILAVRSARRCKLRKRRARDPWGLRSWPLGVPAAWVSGSRTTATRACTRRGRIPCRAGTLGCPHSSLKFTSMAVTRFL